MSRFYMIRATMLRLIAAGMLFSALPVSAQQVVGRVLLASGEVSAVRNGQTVRLQFNSPIEFQDVLRTGPASSLQIRFVDEGLLSVRENSEFAIEDYQFANRPETEQRSFFRLVKGGFRAVTGAIGRINHANYRVRTETATVGIRGTDYVVRQCAGDCGAGVRDGLYGSVMGMSGGTNQITVNNNAGETVFGINQHFHVPDANTRPQPLLQPPAFIAVKPQGKAQAAQEGGSGTGGEQAGAGSGAQAESRPAAVTETTSTFTPTIVAVQPFQATVSAAPTFLPPASGFVVVVPGRLGGPFGDFFFDDDFTTGVFNSQNQLISYSVSHPAMPSFSGFTLTGSLGGGSITDAGTVTLTTGQVVSWGRWTGNTSVDLYTFSVVNGVSVYTPVPSTGVPALFGTATGLGGSNTAIGTVGGTANYSFLDGPRPVDFGGNVGSITNSSLSIDLTHLTSKYSLGMSFPSVVANGVNTGSAVFNVSGTGFTPFAFSSSSSSCVGCGEFFGFLSGSCTGGGCASSTAGGTYDVALAGAGGLEFAAVAGLLFQGTKAGDVAFLNGHLLNSFASGPAPVGPLWAQIAWSDPTYAPASTWTISSGDGAFNSSHQLTGFQNSFCTAPSNCLISANLTGAIVEAGATGLVDGGIMTWGRWNASTLQDRFSGIVNTYSPPGGVPFIAGSQNGFQFPTGSFVYNLAGGPAATNNAGAVGSPLTQGAFNIAFSSNMTISVATPLQFSVGGVNYALNSLSSAGGFTCSAGTCTGPLNTIPALFFNGTCSGACTHLTGTNATGIFFGAQAGGFGVAGNVMANNSTSPLPTATFAAGFKR